MTETRSIVFLALLVACSPGCSGSSGEPIGVGATPESGGAPLSGGSPNGTGGTSPSSGGTSSGGSTQTGGTAAGGTGGTGGADATGGTKGTDCASRTDLVLCEDFEGTSVGEVPAGWTGQGDAKVTDEGARGTRALRIGAAENGPRRISRASSTLGTHWGRLYYRVQTPTPAAFAHSTIVELTGEGPNLGTAWYRVVDTVQNAERKHQFLFNVQPASSGEFGKGSAYDWSFSDEWQCAEWYVDGATQTYRFFLNEDEVTTIGISNGAGNYGTDANRTHLPATFSNVSVGWYNYQAASPGFVAWFDDLAIGTERIYCD